MAAVTFAEIPIGALFDSVEPNRLAVFVKTSDCTYKAINAISADGNQLSVSATDKGIDPSYGPLYLLTDLRLAIQICQQFPKGFTTT